MSTPVDCPIRVLMVAPTSFFSDYGCHVRILEETQALQRLGHEVLVCTYHNGDDVPGIPVRRSLDIPWRKRAVVGSSRHKLYLDAVLSIATLRAARSFRPHLIHAHLHEGALIGSVVGKLLRRPVVFDYQGSLSAEMVDHGFIDSGSFLERVVRHGERVIDRLPDRIITSSENARERLILDGFDECRVVAMLDAVDTHRFDRCAISPSEKAALRRELGIAEDRPLVGYLGLLAPYQGTDLLLRAAREVIQRRPDAFFLVMGFPGVDAYHARAVELGLEAHTSFPGRIPYREAHRYLSILDVAVAPKMSLTEGNGKLYNYMSMALPVVAFDAQANREILGDDGVYVSHGSVSGLSEAILSLIEQPARAAEIGCRLRSRAEEHLSWQRRIDELINIYGSVLARD